MKNGVAFTTGNLQKFKSESAEDLRPHHMFLAKRNWKTFASSTMFYSLTKL